MARMTVEAQALVGQKGPRLPAKDAPHAEWVKWRHEHLGSPLKAEEFQPHTPVEIELNGAKVAMRLPSHLDATLRDKVAAIGGTQADYNHLASVVLQEYQQAPQICKSILEKTYGPQGAQQIMNSAQSVLNLIPDVGEASQPGLRTQVRELIATSPELQVAFAHIAPRLGESSTPSPGQAVTSSAVNRADILKQAQAKDAEWLALLQKDPRDPKIRVLQLEAQSLMLQAFQADRK